MGKSAESKEIKGAVYTVNQLAPTEALSLLIDLIKMIGPAAGSVVSGVFDSSSGESVLDKDVGETLKSAFVGEALKGLLAGLDKDVIKRSIDTLAKATNVSFAGGDAAGAQLSKVYEAHFMGNLGALIQWLAFAMGVQFSDFLGDLGSVVSTIFPKKAKATQQ